MRGAKLYNTKYTQIIKAELAWGGFICIEIQTRLDPTRSD